MGCRIRVLKPTTRVTESVSSVVLVKLDCLLAAQLMASQHRCKQAGRQEDGQPGRGHCFAPEGLLVCQSWDNSAVPLMTSSTLHRRAYQDCQAL